MPWSDRNSPRLYSLPLHDALPILDHVNENFSLVQLRFGQHLIDPLPLGPNAPAPAPEHGVDHLCLSIRCDDLETVAARPRPPGGAGGGGGGRGGGGGG